MEASVLLGILGIGYLLNNNKENDNNNNDDIKNLPIEADAYKSDYFKESDQEYKKRIFENYEKSKIPGSKVINFQNINEYLNEPEESNENSDYIYSSSAGGKILKENFLVNNQGIKVEPFFGGKPPPNIKFDENTQLRRHQGSQDLKTKKTEQPNFFQPSKQNVHGSQFDGDNLMSKYVTSKINNNVRLWLKVQKFSPG